MKPGGPAGVVLPLATVLAKLGNDPQQLLGWEVRVGAPAGQHSGKSHTRSNGSPTVAQAAATRAPMPDLGVVVAVEQSPGSSGSGTAAAGRSSNTDARKSLYQHSSNSNAAKQLQQQTAAQPQQGQVVLRVVRRATLRACGGFEGDQVLLLPLEPGAGAARGDVAGRVLWLDAVPTGPLDDARRGLLLQLIRRELLELGRQGPGLEPGLELAAGTHGPSSEPDAPVPGRPAQTQQRPGCKQERQRQWKQEQELLAAIAMPSRQQLLAAGREELVEAIGAAGGFAEVALQLGLRCSRRPHGFWSGPGSWRRLAAELAGFVAAAWTELPAPDEPGRVYYYNQVSGRTTWRRPAAMAAASSWAAGGMEAAADGGGARGGGGGKGALEAETAADRVMPSRAVIMQANRRDLHGAIMLHGGYEAVAAALGRRVTWAVSRRLVGGPPEELRRELEAAAAELGLPAGVMPTARELQDLGRGALLTAVRQRGGFQVVARQLRFTPRGKRRPRGSWEDPKRLAAELAAFAAAAASPPSVSATEVGRSSSSQPLGPESQPSSGGQERGTVAERPPGQDEGGGQQRGRQPPPALLPFPTRSQLLAAGRQDLVAALQNHYHGPDRRALLAELGGLRLTSRRGTNRNALRLELVVAAIQAGHHTPAAIRGYLEAQAGVQVSLQYLGVYLRRHCAGAGAGAGAAGPTGAAAGAAGAGDGASGGADEGLEAGATALLVRLGYGRYGLAPDIDSLYDAGCKVE
ncbi:hypothetical protein HXX76_015433 [Chlamydomonas incerta]|uniref:WW domain-containing protein n=1 Tax=Chlamydomonas incerta TaxID=51695 RepID=A0A835VRX7_CHLIN|nr:hypothetical protein HXX76_015433 [Chlamydomonas incerta]|eukprot:KAG2423284.1 hypothetical protein HXX76_015433 [Chlamydomonas incerta]